MSRIVAVALKIALAHLLRLRAVPDHAHSSVSSGSTGNVRLSATGGQKSNCVVTIGPGRGGIPDGGQVGVIDDVAVIAGRLSEVLLPSASVHRVRFVCVLLDATRWNMEEK